MSLPISPHSIITEADTCIPTSEVPLYPSQFLPMVPAHQASSIPTTRLVALRNLKPWTVYSSVKGFFSTPPVHDQLGHQVYQMRGILLGRLSSGNQVAGSIETLGGGGGHKPPRKFELLSCPCLRLPALGSGYSHTWLSASC